MSVWINNTDDEDRPKSYNSKYISIDSPGEYHETIINIEVEIKELLFWDMKEGMPDMYETSQEIKGEVLEICYLGIEDISQINGLEKLTELKRLDIGMTNIVEIKNLEKLINLEYLSLSNNQIKEIKNLDKLVNLKGLNLMDNQISEIKGLENLVNLNTLILEVNKISQIEGLESLVNLRYFDIGGNSIHRNMLNHIVGTLFTIDPKKLRKMIVDTSFPLELNDYYKNQKESLLTHAELEKKHGIDSTILVEINSELRLFKIDGYQNKCPFCGEIIEEIRPHLYNCEFFPKNFGLNCVIEKCK